MPFVDRAARVVRVRQRELDPVDVDRAALVRIPDRRPRDALRQTSQPRSSTCATTVQPNLLAELDRVADVVVVAVRERDQVDPLRLLLARPGTSGCRATGRRRRACRPGVSKRKAAWPSQVSWTSGIVAPSRAARARLTEPSSTNASTGSLLPLSSSGRAARARPLAAQRGQRRPPITTWPASARPAGGRRGSSCRRSR